MFLNPATAAPVPADPAWRGRLQILAAFLLVTVPAAWLSEFNPALFFDASSLNAARQFVATFYPPAHSADFLMLLAKSTWQTIAIATCGMAIALAASIPLAMAATRTLSISRIGRPAIGVVGRAVRAAIRWLLIALRSVPELVWALMFVRAVGLGDTAGVLAIALAYTGMIGKVYLEIFESQDQRAAEALLAGGAGRMGAFLYGTLPDCLPELVSYAVYRWECAIRSSVILGFVGAGGLGMQMELSMKMLAGGEVIVFLVAFLALVSLADLVSRWLRRWLA